MVFTAHRPHPLGKKVFFGYFKQDGFEKRKGLGRLDINGLWNDEIESLWLNAFINRETIPGISVLQSVAADDEWCAEAYMNTDYSDITLEDFEDIVRQYIAAAIVNRFPGTALAQQILSAFPSEKTTKLFCKNVECVPIRELFDSKYGANLEQYKFDESKSTSLTAIPFVSRSDSNNGIAAYVEKRNDLLPNPAHTLSVAGGGSVLSTYYQEAPYYSGRDVYYLTPKSAMDIIDMLFYSMVIRENKYRYNYGRQANKTFRDILVPKEIPVVIREIREKTKAK